MLMRLMNVEMRFNAGDPEATQAIEMTMADHAKNNLEDSMTRFERFEEPGIMGFRVLNATSVFAVMITEVLVLAYKGLVKLEMYPVKEEELLQ